MHSDHTGVHNGSQLDAPQLERVEAAPVLAVDCHPMEPEICCKVLE